MRPDTIPSTTPDWKAVDLDGRTFRVFLWPDEPTLGEFVAKEIDDSDEPQVKLHFQLRGQPLCWLDLDDYADLGAIRRLPENEGAEFELKLNQIMSKKLLLDCYGSLKHKGSDIPQDNPLKKVPFYDSVHLNSDAKSDKKPSPSHV